MKRTQDERKLEKKQEKTVELLIVLKRESTSKLRGRTGDWGGAHYIHARMVRAK